MRRLLIVLALVGCGPEVNFTPQRAAITAVHCEVQKGAPNDCYTAIRYEDGTTQRRAGVYGEVGDSLVARPCPGSPSLRVWCSFPEIGGGE